MKQRKENGMCGGVLLRYCVRQGGQGRPHQKVMSGQKAVASEEVSHEVMQRPRGENKLGVLEERPGDQCAERWSLRDVVEAWMA